jgi:hypothetical protein
MFGWFASTCPCDLQAKRWIEERLAWLTKQFGLHTLLEKSIVLPTDEFFPDAYDGSEQSLQVLFERICEYMDVDRDSVEIRIYMDRTPGSVAALDPSRGFAAGLWEGGEGPWQKGIIRVEKSTLDRPSDLIGTLAHELSHQRLLGEGRAKRDAYDNELLTDLTAVFHGFGIFLANNPRKSTGELRKWPGTNLHRPEYISEPMLGYALAHMAWFRDEDWPAWASHLRWAQRGVFKQGLRFLQRTNDSTFKPVRLRSGRKD